jgi:hypothetical protein
LLRPGGAGLTPLTPPPPPPTWGERYVMELPKRDQKRAKLALDGCSNNK